MNKKVLIFIYNQRTKKWLALQNKNNPGHEGNFWFTVTGNLESGESYEKAALRETKEETGLEIKKIQDLGWGSYYLWKGRENEEHYFLAFVKDEDIILNEEHASFEWLSLENYIEKIDWQGDKTELEANLNNSVEDNRPFYWKRIDDFILREPKVHLEHDGKRITLTWFKNGDFSGVKPVRQVSTICFNENGEILIVKPGNDWQIPGGKPEGQENYEETLRREADEEGDVDLDKLIPFGYNKVEVFDDRGKRKEIIYQLRYFSIVKKVKPQTIDPAVGRVPERKFIKPKDFLGYCPWGATGKAMIDSATDIWNHHRKGLI